ncbi:MAG TPA: transglutaminase-like cysteine peptidase [Smithellaceae bacterium]|nr:transglutaminase-like cysteine peptidase [Smithellaceae bacterium]
MNKAPEQLRQRIVTIIPLRGIAFLLIMLAVFLQADIAFSDETFHIDQSTLKQATDKWGKEAQSRLLAWENLIRSDQNNSDREKLEKVNAFINKIPYGEDISIWGVADYWATPVEFLGRGAGDCEDYAIAKYFTLRTMGIPDQKLRVTYVKAMQLDRTHMVLTYANKPGDEPLVLDNLDKSIKPASERHDLIPIFSFNGTELWMAQQRGQGESTDSSRLKPWRNLLKRMSEHKS